MSEKMLEGFRDGDKRVTFIGIDWGRKDWTGAVCGRCTTPHRWRNRRPKACRHCGIKFVYTASTFPILTDTELPPNP